MSNGHLYFDDSALEVVKEVYGWDGDLQDKTVTHRSILLVLFK